MDNKRFNVFQEFEQGHFSPAFGFKSDIQGLFRIEYYEMEGKYVLFPIEIKEQDKQIIDIPSAEVQELNNELTGFFDNYDKLKEMGLPRSRGILLTGLPGTGKSKAIEKLALKTIYDYNGLCFDLSGEQLVYYINCFNSQIRAILPNKKVLCVLEDIEQYTMNPPLMSLILNMLSGVGSTEHFFIATSNYPEKIDPRLLRAGRFDRKIRMPLPDSGLREFFFKELFKKSGYKPANMNELITKSEGCSYASLREVAVSLVLYNRHIDEITRILSDLSKTPSPECINRNAIGFGNNNYPQ